MQSHQFCVWLKFIKEKKNEPNTREKKHNDNRDIANRKRQRCRRRRNSHNKKSNPISRKKRAKKAVNRKKNNCAKEKKKKQRLNECRNNNNNNKSTNSNWNSHPFRKYRICTNERKKEFVISVRIVFVVFISLHIIIFHNSCFCYSLKMSVSDGVCALALKPIRPFVCSFCCVVVSMQRCQFSNRNVLADADAEHVEWKSLMYKYMIYCRIVNS